MIICHVGLFYCLKFFERRDRVMNLSPYVALIQLFINMSMP